MCGREDDFRSVLAAYPADCQPACVECLGSAGGFSGARFWRLTTAIGVLGLRCWPGEHPDAGQLEFIQAVLRHALREGFQLAPVPLATLARTGYVRRGGRFWELARWMPGQATYHQAPSHEKLASALSTLARFHAAVATFPLPESGGPSPSISRRRRQLEDLMSGGIERLQAAVSAGDWPELETRARRLLQLFPAVAPRTLAMLQAAEGLRVPIEPCIRDIWHDHLLFTDEQVSGIIDFGAMRPDSVAGDVARLLGSLVGDDSRRWRDGLDAYQRVRPLSGDELALITAFDRSTVLMAGINWIDWIYVQGRRFEGRTKIIARLDETLRRLEHLATTAG